MRKGVFFLLSTLIVTGSFLLLQAKPAAAETVEELQAKIADRNARLAEIQKEIAGYEASLKEVGAERSTLESAISSLELERKKITADITYTQNQISSTDLEISKLSLEIKDTNTRIEDNRAAIAEILRNINAYDQEETVEVLLTNENLADFWNALEDLDSVRASMNDKITELTDLNSTLANKKGEETDRRSDLVDLQQQYSDQHAILTNNKDEKDKLLTETKSQESNYQALLAQKKASQEQLLKEVADIEAQIQYIVDPNSIPTKGSAVFRWPINNPIITQYFGYTKFALSGAYNGSKHNGMDLGTPVGTPIYAPLSGTVRDTGNTDLVAGCYSWGKWILIDHPNGLSSLFAHLSQISVVPGQKVSTGDVISYTGNTGYSTGPHLHWTVYISDAVQVKQFNEFKSVTSCGPAKSPFSAIEGYLNPLDYLPAL